MNTKYSLNHKLNNTIIFTDYNSPLLNHINTNSLVNYDIEGSMQQEFSNVLLPALPIARVLALSNKYALLAFTYANWNGYLHTAVEVVNIQDLNNCKFLSDITKNMVIVNKLLLSEEELLSTEKQKNHLFIKTEYGYKDVTPQGVLFTNDKVAIVAQALNGQVNTNDLFFTSNKTITGKSQIDLQNAKYNLEDTKNLTAENCLANILDKSRIYDNKFVKSLVKKISEYNYNNPEKSKFINKVYDRLSVSRYDQSIVL